MSEKPKFLEFITPVGRIMYANIDTPQVEENEHTKQPKLDDQGMPIAHYKVTLAWPKAEQDTTLIPFRQIAAQARDLKWPVGSYDPNFFALQPFLRDGDNPEHNTKNKAELRGMVYMTFKARAKAARHAQTGQVVYSGAPGLVGPYNEDLLPVDVYSGAYARVSGIAFGTEYSGKKFISVRLNNVQKAKDGERLGGGRPDAKSQFDPLATGPAPTTAFAGGALPSVL